MFEMLLFRNFNSSKNPVTKVEWVSQKILKGLYVEFWKLCYWWPL